MASRRSLRSLFHTLRGFGGLVAVVEDGSDEGLMALRLNHNVLGMSEKVASVLAS